MRDSGGHRGGSSALRLASGIQQLRKVMFGGKCFGLLPIIQLSISKLSRDPCPCQSDLGGLYKVGILSLFAGSVKQSAATWTTNLLQFGHITLVPQSWRLLPPPSLPSSPLPPPPPPPLPFPLAIAVRRAEFCFMMRSNCFYWVSSSVCSRSTGSGLSRVGERSFATYSCAAASDSLRLSM
jgi:hypothetical protein